MSRTCIIVSPYFPPSTLAGVHRARHLAKHLPAAGWTPIVVAVHEDFHEERLDPDLAALVPASVEIVKVPALSQRVCRPLGLGEISLRAWRPLRRAVLALLSKRSVDAVLITGSPYYPMLLGPEIKRRFGVPVVLDFQDPWVSAWGMTLPRWSKAGLAHRLAEALEPRAVRAADFITSVSETQNDQLAARYRWLDRSRMAAIPIGGDPDDFHQIRVSSPEDKLELFKPGAVTFCYVGTFMPRSRPLMECFFEAFGRARRENSYAMERVRLVFVGTSNQPNDTTSFRVRPLAEQTGVAEAVHEVPQRVPFLEAIGILARADGILLIGSDEPHYTASKIYPGMMAQRPFISIFHQASSTHTILSAAGGGIALSFRGAAALPELVAPLCNAIVRLATAADTLGRTDPAAYRDYTAASIAQQYAAIFQQLARRAQKAQPGSLLCEATKPA
jgi:glycosyltransferase involved in cell wall biosynthesis